MEGILYGIGVGPGDPEMITVKALRIIRESDVILLPSQPKEDCLSYQTVCGLDSEIGNKEIICLPFVMTKEKKVLQESHDRIYEEVAALLRKGKKAAFLTIGDPSIYSTYSYIHARVLENGGRAQMISGVTSFCGAAAALGISLGDGSEQIHIIPGSYQVEDTLFLEGTRIYMKSGKKLGELKKALLEAGQEETFEIYAVSDCGMSSERMERGLDNLDENSGYLTLVVMKERKG